MSRARFKVKSLLFDVCSVFVVVFQVFIIQVVLMVIGLGKETESLTLTFRKGCLCNLVSILLPNFYSVAVFRSHLRAFLFIYFFDLYNLFSWPR